jgi:hypothetical protein
VVGDWWWVTRGRYSISICCTACTEEDILQVRMTTEKCVALLAQAFLREAEDNEIGIQRRYRHEVIKVHVRVRGDDTQVLHADGEPPRHDRVAQLLPSPADVLPRIGRIDHHLRVSPLTAAQQDVGKQYH